MYLSIFMIYSIHNSIYDFLCMSTSLEVQTTWFLEDGSYQLKPQWLCCRWIPTASLAMKCHVFVALHGREDGFFLWNLTEIGDWHLMIGWHLILAWCHNGILMEYMECRSFTPGTPSKCVRFFTFTAVVQGSIWTFWNIGLHGLERQSADVAVDIQTPKDGNFNELSLPMTGTSLVNDAVSTSTSPIISNSLQPLPLEHLSSHECDLEVQSLACFSHMTLGLVKIDWNFKCFEGVWNIALAFQCQSINMFPILIYVLLNLTSLVA